MKFKCKTVMSLNLTTILQLVDDLGVCAKDLRLAVDYETYGDIINDLNNGMYNEKEMELLFRQLKNDYKYLKRKYEINIDRVIFNS